MSSRCNIRKAKESSPHTWRTNSGAVPSIFAPPTNRKAIMSAVTFRGPLTDSAYRQRAPTIYAWRLQHGRRTNDRAGAFFSSGARPARVVLSTFPYPADRLTHQSCCEFVGIMSVSTIRGGGALTHQTGMEIYKIYRPQANEGGHRVPFPGARPSRIELPIACTSYHTGRHQSSGDNVGPPSKYIPVKSVHTYLLSAVRTDPDSRFVPRASRSSSLPGQTPIHGPNTQGRLTNAVSEHLTIMSPTLGPAVGGRSDPRGGVECRVTRS